ncbi:MAG TPA: DNA mismatch endonuclease Vsr [Armatimonadota bacterium]|nr:DNA mismatch endonuclease Vsr [Armatimonadota bacterium]
MERDISGIMRKVRSADTGPEIRFRHSLWERGVRYRLGYRDLPGKPDLVIPAHKLAIFIDGDFWHGNQWRRRGLKALAEQFSGATSRDYWLKKIRRNMRRDADVTDKIIRMGWTVLRFWESQVLIDLEGCVQMTLTVLKPDLDGKPSLLYHDSYNDGTDPANLLPAKTVAEFFAGIGLMRMGLDRQGWTVKFANDIEPEKLELYAAQFPDAREHFRLEDIHNLLPNEMPSVTLATASFPCNDLSLAGARKGLAGKQSSAFWGFTRLLDGLAQRKPPIILLENVTGFLTSHGGADFRSAMLSLNALGYSVDPFILDAASFVPQSRQRLFVVGVLNALLGPERAAEGPGFYESEARPKALADFIFTDTEIGWYLRNLPAPPKRVKELEDILEDLPYTDKAWWSGPRASYLLSQMSERHREIADRMISGPEYTFGAVFRRVRNGKCMAELRTDGIAGCLRTPRGGSGRQILFKAGRGRYFVRLFTARECARLMGADDYLVNVPLNQALFGFGDAVCVPVVEWIAANYLNPLVNELIRGRPLRKYSVLE